MLRYHKQKGFIILIVLVFMQIFMLMNWYAIENILLVINFSKNDTLHDGLVENAKKLLAQAESFLITKVPSCVISFSNSSRLIVMPLSWWQAKSCSGKFQSFKYYYVVEPLSADSCAIVDQAKNMSAAYFRITLFFDSNNDESRLFLQSTLVRPNTTTLLEPCKDLQHKVQVGRQSLHELDY